MIPPPGTMSRRRFSLARTYGQEVVCPAANRARRHLSITTPTNRDQAAVRRKLIASQMRSRPPANFRENRASQLLSVAGDADDRRNVFSEPVRIGPPPPDDIYDAR